VRNLKLFIKRMLSMKKSLLLSVIVVKGVSELLFLFGLLGWVYGVLVQLIHPEWLHLGLSHLTPWIRIDTFTIISFIISAVGFFIWRLTRELLSRSS
jgi:hypothetical protein